MFAEERLDLVSIVAPTSLHLPVTLAALAAGANVLVEKPIASDRAEAEAMIAAAERAGPDPDRRPHRALQPGDPRAAGGGWPPASSAASSRSRPRGWVPSRRAFATSGS